MVYKKQPLRLFDSCDSRRHADGSFLDAVCSTGRRDGRVCRSRPPSREQSGQAFPASSGVFRQTSTQSDAPSAGSRERLNSIYKRLFARTVLSEPCLTSRRSNGNYVLSRHSSTGFSLFYQNRQTTTKRPIEWVLQIML